MTDSNYSGALGSRTAAHTVLTNRVIDLLNRMMAEGEDSDFVASAAVAAAAAFSVFNLTKFGHDLTVAEVSRVAEQFKGRMVGI